MNLKGIVSILTLMATLLLGFTFVGPAETQYPGYGPATPEMRLFYYADETALYSAVKAGQIDLSLWEATRAQYTDAITDPNIILCPVSRLDMKAFSLNNNETIATYPGVRIATSYVDFRKALWCMVDRAYYTEVICGGFATPVYTMISAPSRSWVNVTVENYVKSAWAFSVQTAANYLDAGGFAQIVGDTNPNYKPGVPGSAQYMRGYPAGHSKAGQRVDPVVFVARVDDGLRYAASIHLRDRMLESGIQVNFLSMPSSTAFTRVMTARDYQIYSASWTTGRFATYSWSWYHTSRWVPGGSNYHVSPTSPGYDLTTKPDKRPEDLFDLDYEASKVWYPPTLADAVTAAKNVQSLSTMKYATFIPLWSGESFFYYRNLYGVTNMDGVGLENTYTFQSVKRADGGSTIRVGHKSPPTQVNQIYSSWEWDVTTMRQTQDGFYNLEPYNILNEQPGLAQDWTNAPGAPSAVPGTWVDPDDDQTKSYMRYWFMDDPNDGLGDADAEWIKPGSPGAGGGSVLADFTPQWLGGGYEFNSWYFDNEPAGYIYPSYKDIKHIECNSAGKYADVYFDASSYWSYQWPWGRQIYAVEPASTDQTYLGWKSTPLSSQQTRSFAGPIADGTYLHTLTPISGSPIPKRASGAPVEVIELRIDGVLQIKATTPHLYDPATGLGAGGDYSIVGSSLDGPSIRTFKDVLAGSTLTVTYWARGDPAGYWPGNTNFQTTLAGTGQYYMTDFLAGAGGWATYKANPHNYMQTPPWGEIDFHWYWLSGPQPRDGYYQVDDLDVALASAALGGSGNYIPTTNWIPGCDLAPPLGVIDVTDLAWIEPTYLTYWGSPSPNPPPPFHDVAVTDVTISKTVVMRGKTVTVDVTLENQGGYDETFDVSIEANSNSIHTETIFLESRQSTTFAFEWNTAGFSSGSYEISAYADPVSEEEDLADNLYTDGTVLVKEAAVSVYPVVVGPPPKIGEAFNVNITIGDVIDLYTWQAGLTFDSTVLEALNIAEGEFLKKAGVPTLWTPGSIDNTNGIIHYSACSITGPNPGVDGSGQLMSITFSVKNSGESTLSPTDVLLLDSDLTPIEPVNTFDGSVTIHSQDIAILSVTASASEAYPTWIVPLDITVVVENQGTRTETFDVTVYANTIAIETKPVTLAAGANTALVYHWNLAGAVEGTYTIRAEATILYGEIDTADNVLTDGTVRIKHPGDANGDGILNAYDLGILAQAWGTSVGQPLYDPRADFNGDETIDTLDHEILKAYWP